MTYNYCRHKNAEGVLCGRRIARATSLHWCDECRAERLPLWPANDEPLIAADSACLMVVR